MMRLDQAGKIFCVSFDNNGLVVRASRVRELPSGDFRALLEVMDGDVPLHSSTVNLCTASGRQAVVRSLNGSRDDWPHVIDLACSGIVHRLMQGSPAEEIFSEVPVSPQRYLLDPLLPLDQPSILFGKPGSTKSYLALLWSILVQLPHPANPFGWATGKQCANILYCDNETSRDTIHRRLQELLRGMGLPPLHIHYKRLTGSLPAELEDIQQVILEKDIRLVVVDSAGKGCGGDINAAQPVNDFFTALNQLGTTSLVIHHEPKDFLLKDKTPYGSAYFEAGARSVWHVERGQGTEDDFTVMLKHMKANDSALHRPIGLMASFSQGPEGKSVRFQPTDLRDSEFAPALPLRERIADLLRSGSMSAPDIAEKLSEGPAKVRVILNRNDKTFTKVGPDWGLLANV